MRDRSRGRPVAVHMWFPEESITYCDRCDDDISHDHMWRGTGTIVSNGGGEVRTLVLYSLCPGCSRRLSQGLDGPLWYRLLYAWIWKLRYPRVRPPKLQTISRSEIRRKAS
jgi:hypothetical protein